MKSIACLAVLAALCSMLPAQTPDPAKSTPAPRLVSDLYDWEKLVVTPNAKGVRRAIFDGPTATVDKMHCHSTTLNPGEKSGEPSKHLQEEVIIVKEGLVEANWDGKSKTGGPGSVVFFAAGATTFYAPSTESVLDLALARQVATRETAYSEPLAFKSFIKEPMERNGQPVRDFARLKFGGAHLSDPDTQ